MLNPSEPTKKSNDKRRRRGGRKRGGGGAKSSDNRSSTSAYSSAASTSSSGNNTPSPRINRQSAANNSATATTSTIRDDNAPIGFKDERGNFDFSNKESSIYQTASGRQIMYLTDRAKLAAQAELLADATPFRMPNS